MVLTIFIHVCATRREEFVCLRLHVPPDGSALRARAAMGCALGIGVDGAGQVTSMQQLHPPHLGAGAARGLSPLKGGNCQNNIMAAVLISGIDWMRLFQRNIRAAGRDRPRRRAPNGQGR